jgi:hypothetical protein
MLGPTLGVQVVAAAAGTFSLGAAATDAATPAIAITVAAATRPTFIPSI